MAKSIPSITRVEPSFDEELRRKRRNYTIVMAVRTACFIAMPFARGWWLVVLAAGAIFLPWFAVMFANATRPVLRGPVSNGARIVPELSGATHVDADSAAGPTEIRIEPETPLLQSNDQRPHDPHHTAPNPTPQSTGDDERPAA